MLEPDGGNTGPTLVRVGSKVVVGYKTDHNSMDAFAMQIFDTASAPHGQNITLVVEDVDVSPDSGGAFRLFEVDDDRFALWYQVKTGKRSTQLKVFGANGTLLLPGFPVVDSYSYPTISGLCVSGDVLAFVTQSGGPDSLHYGLLDLRTLDLQRGVLHASEPEGATCVAHPEGFSMIWSDDESESSRQRFVYLDGTVG